MPSSLRGPRAVVVLAAVALALTGCASDAGGAAERLTPSPVSSSGIQADITYTTADGAELKLDACLPTSGASASTSTASGVPAIVILHGGGFTTGSRSTGGSRTVCELVAKYGFAAFSVDYRLVPHGSYPDQVEDVQHAIEWLREPAQVARFGIDSTRIGLLGSSAGAILAQTVATTGSGSLTTGSRVKAVVSLSGVSDLSPSAVKLGKPADDLVSLVLAYLGCTSLATCKDGAAASAITHVDGTDPPMLLVNSTKEIVPVEQPEAMRDALKKAGVPVSLVLVPGSAHGFSLLDSQVRDAVKAFLAEEL